MDAKTFDEKKLQQKYRCSLGNGGWCDGKQVGSRMRCPAHSLCSDRKSRVCEIGHERGLDEMICQFEADKQTKCNECLGWNNQCSPDWYPDYIDDPDHCVYFKPKI